MFSKAFFWWCVRSRDCVVQSYQGCLGSRKSIFYQISSLMFDYNILWELRAICTEIEHRFCRSQTSHDRGRFEFCYLFPQTTTFTLFQTERVCRRQWFQILRKWHNVLQTVRKHCGKRKKCSLRAISPFPTVFSQGLYQRHVKTMDCMGKGYSLLNNIRRHVYYLTHSLTHHFGPSQIQRSCKRLLDIWLVKDFKKNLHRKHWGKRWNCSSWAISPFSTMFFPKAFLFNVMKLVYMEERVIIFWSKFAADEFDDMFTKNGLWILIKAWFIGYIESVALCYIDYYAECTVVYHVPF